MEESREAFDSARTYEGHLRHHHTDFVGDVSRRSERNRMAAALHVLGRGLPKQNSRDAALLVAAAKRFVPQRPIKRLARGGNIGVTL